MRMLAINSTFVGPIAGVNSLGGDGSLSMVSIQARFPALGKYIRSPVSQRKLHQRAGDPRPVEERDPVLADPPLDFSTRLRALALRGDVGRYRSSAGWLRAVRILG